MRKPGSVAPPPEKLQAESIRHQTRLCPSGRHRYQMNALLPFARSQPVAHAIVVLAAVAVLGLALGALKYRGVGLGSAGVLFAGILFGRFGNRIDPAIVDFVQEFGLVLFVFAIGMQLGPGFFAALRQRGLQLNAMALAIIGLGTLITVAGAWLLKVDFAAAVGLLSGATTNTPSLGAAQQALIMLREFPPDRIVLPALGCALAYPVGIACGFCAVLALRTFFRIDVRAEAEHFRAEQQRGMEPLGHATLIVDNRALDGKSVAQFLHETQTIVSRLRPAGQTEVVMAQQGTRLHIGDALLAVGTRPELKRVAELVGHCSKDELTKEPGRVMSQKVVVTHKSVLGKTIGEIGLGDLYGVTITRVTRGDLEMLAAPSLRLRFGDVLQVVGDRDDIGKAAEVLGNSLKTLNETQFIPLFLGIALGIVAGMAPIPFPGMPVPLRLGLAGGPLILAIVLSRIGHLGRLVWHMPANANLAFRELGLTLFLACVGLEAGEKFFSIIFTRTGLLWVVFAAGVALVPLLIVGGFARGVLKVNFLLVSGLIAGSTTNPPVLAFAGSAASSDAPSLAYATVYPLTMLLRIITAQAIVLALSK